MAIQINGNGTITGISAGGLPSGSLTLAASDMPTGSVIQVVEHKLTTQHTTATGDQWHYSTLTGAITTQFANSKVLVDQCLNIAGQGTNQYTISGKLYRNDAEVTDANSTVTGSRPNSWWTVGSQSWYNYDRYNVCATYLDTPGSAATFTYKIYVRDYRDSGELNINRPSYDNDSTNSPVGKSILTLTEIRG